MMPICFDLEGTLLDPMEGFARCLATAWAECPGIPCPSPTEIAPFVGLDLDPLFQRIPSPGIRAAVRDRFWQAFAEEGVLDQRAQPGIHLLLARLKRQGHRLLLASGQPQDLARRVLHHVDLNLVFDGVGGPPPGGPWRPKAEVLDPFARDGAFRSGGVLIGDRGDDIAGGRAHGLWTIGVAYGYGSREELAEAGADLILGSVAELDDWLAEHAGGPEIHDPFSRSE